MLRRCVLLLVGVVVLVGTPSARAAEGVVEQAWTRTTPVGTFVAQQGRIYVAATGGLEEARAFVQLRAGVTPPDGWILLSEADDTLGVSTPSVVACLLEGSLARSGELGPADAPAADCRTQTLVTRDASGTWSVDVGVFLDSWRSSASPGLVLIPEINEGDPGTFRLSFDASATTRTGGDPGTTDGVDSAPRTPIPERRAQRPSSAWNIPSFALPEVTAPQDAAAAIDPTTPRAALQEGQPRTASPDSVRSTANGPPTALFFVLLLAVSLAVLGRRSIRHRIAVPPRVRGLDRASAIGYGTFMVFALLPVAGSQLTVFRSGLVVIFVVAAIGLHLLVNWAGELSLAHAAMIGLPAFVVAGLSEVAGVSPIYLLPFGVATGAAVGCIVALPVLRSRGLQVALVTLVAGKAIERYFYSQEWLSPQGGRVVSDITLGPLSLATPRSLYPLLLLVAGAAVAVAWALLHSKLARAWFWVRADPSAAASFGIPVVRYRILAYVVGGSFAGLAGGLTVMWVQRLSPSAFPTTLSVTYLVVAVLAGPGFVGGVALAGGALEAGRLFGSGSGPLIAYAGPVALVLTITRYQAGLNGIGRSVMRRLRARTGGPQSGEATDPSGATEPIYPSFIIGVVAITAGFLAIVLAWYHAGNTNQVWIQNQEMISGGFGGVALVLTGTGLLIRDRLIHTQRLLTKLSPSVAPLDPEQRSDTATGQFTSDHPEIRVSRRASRAMTSR